MKTKDAAEFFGSRSKLAKALGVFPSAVSQWGDEVPLVRQYQIQVLSKGRLKADQSNGRPAASDSTEHPKTAA
ncbi:Cro/Cl family transcriptional regulator [Pseudomonas cavernicola]|uniref:Cro/Cl family transcriptional regulator n=1 Tax=Pseudomonas cavernicola TaxID=2320866 RepID=A0A418XEN1_9PSED|nr:Cro/CI family transcriptional regulator [Pseudomonas cavernicola]RJG10949.1 Cro/Cl family transcriptional regulator [Pseudomonas cavernicola]